MKGKRKAAVKVDRPHGTPKAVLNAFSPVATPFGGTALNPLSLGHALALERIHSPFVEADVPMSVEAAVRAAFLLSMEGDAALRLAGSPDFETAFGKFASALPASAAVGAMAVIGGIVKAAFDTADTGSGREGDAESPLADSAGG